MAPWAVTAAFPGFLCFHPGPAAAGIAKFLWGRAFLTMAGGAGDVLVRFAARARVFGIRFFRHGCN
jgi:hypothetical protein